MIENLLSFNPYGYVQGNPTIFTHPNGDFPPLLIAIVIGAVAGAAGGAVIGGAADVAIQTVQGMQCGLSFGEAVGRIDWHQTATAVRDGAILGALTGATGGAAAGLGLGVGATAAVAIGSDVAFGTAYDSIVYGENPSDAFGRNLVFGIAGFGIGEAFGRAARSWRGGARAAANAAVPSPAMPTTYGPRQVDFDRAAEIVGRRRAEFEALGIADARMQFNTQNISDTPNPFADYVNYRTQNRQSIVDQLGSINFSDTVTDNQIDTVVLTRYLHRTLGLQEGTPGFFGRAYATVGAMRVDDSRTLVTVNDNFAAARISNIRGLGGPGVHHIPGFGDIEVIDPSTVTSVPNWLGKSEDVPGKPNRHAEGILIGYTDQENLTRNYMGISHFDGPCPRGCLPMLTTNYSQLPTFWSTFRR